MDFGVNVELIGKLLLFFIIKMDSDTEFVDITPSDIKMPPNKWKMWVFRKNFGRNMKKSPRILRDGRQKKELWDFGAHYVGLFL